VAELVFCAAYNQKRIDGDIMFEKIKELRLENEYTQKEISEILGCSQQVYSNYELGQRDLPTQVLMKLSVIYDVSTDYILGLTQNPARNS